MHSPVLLQNAIEALEIKRNGLYIDATLGEGGHLDEMLKRKARVLAIDWDEEQIEREKGKRKREKEVAFVVANFADIEKIAKEYGFFPADGVLFDLGLSYGQIEGSGRGFSYVLFDLGLSYGQIEGSGRGFSYRRLEEPLDMRISTSLEKSAADLVNKLSQQDLYEIFTKNSEEVDSWAIAQGIVRARRIKPIKRVGDLVEVINAAAKRKSVGTHARIFQALRIAVNNEFENLKEGLAGAETILKIGGRLVVITFHSLEDRIVKRFMRRKTLRDIGKKIRGGRAPFERSAILRVAEKIA
ncbi:16S rRNA (cytosine(1402)-N(4))-methyltransferase RsmH [Candidatus Roizmanbacteria bacterium]|nr:16S rRNA (cytosine(1402)-N(4))-methyltransferase RsmH [Candidatus Roizmanbacteria bacterium]